MPLLCTATLLCLAVKNLLLMLVLLLLRWGAVHARHTNGLDHARYKVL